VIADRGRLYLAEDSGGYDTHWYCEPPEKGARFRVIRDEWHDDGGLMRPVREIYEIAPPVSESGPVA